MSILLSSSSTFNDLFKQEYEPMMQNQIITESELRDLFSEVGGFTVTEGADGKQINLAHMFSAGGGVGTVAENDYIYGSTDPDIKQSFINIKQWQATVELSGRVLRRAKEGPAAFASWAEVALPEKVKRLVFHQDRALMGAGTGILFQITGTAQATAQAVNNAYGISGLEGATFNCWESDSVRYASDAAGTSLRVGPAIIKNTSFAAGTIDTDILPTSAAAGDYVFLGDANVTSNGVKDNMGLEGIVDDGTNVATFQGLSRTTFKGMQGQVVNSLTANGGIYNGILSEDMWEFADRVSYERGLGKGDVAVTSRSGRMSYQKDLRSDRVLNDPLSTGGYKGGVDTGGTKTGGPSVSLGDRSVRLRVARKCPTSRAFLLQRDTLKMYRLGAGRWDDTQGSIWARSIDTTGRKDAFYATFVEEFEVACNRPVGNVKITNLIAA